MNNIVEIQFVVTHPDAVIPTRKHNSISEGDTGLDLTSIADVVVPSMGNVVVPIGLTLGKVSPGFWLKIESRSSLGFKHSVFAHPGIIDNSYRGDLGVKLYSLNKEKDYHIQKGDRIAQLVIYPLYYPVCSVTDQVSETARGAGGFGSTGK